MGDTVRISKTRRPFQKGYLPNWTEEVFTISARHRRANLSVYELKDLLNRPIKGANFYESELQKVKKPTSFRIERIVRRRGDSYLVKWRGYSDDFNTWLNKEELNNINNNDEENLSAE